MNKLIYFKYFFSFIFMGDCFNRFFKFKEKKLIVDNKRNQLLFINNNIFIISFYLLKKTGIISTVRIFFFLY